MGGRAGRRAGGLADAQAAPSSRPALHPILPPSALDQHPITAAKPQASRVDKPSNRLFSARPRPQVGVIYGNPEVTSGGQSLQYYASVRVDLRVRERIQGPAGQVGIRVK